MAGELVPQGQFLIYTDGGLNLRVRLDGQTVWLTQRLIAELFDVTVPNVNHHLKSIYEEGELQAQATIKQYLIVQTDGAAEVEDDGEPFTEKMARLVPERNGQFAESAGLEATIRAKLRGLGYGE